jgi:hypothetical protein
MSIVLHFEMVLHSSTEYIDKISIAELQTGYVCGCRLLGLVVVDVVVYGYH